MWLNKNLSVFAPILTRISLSIVFLWFGINQVIDPEYFIGYLPEFILNSANAKTFILFNGIFEIVFGSLLIIGLFTRVASLILALHLFAIIIGLGYNDIAVRDFGLALVAIAIFLGGADKWCLDYRRKKL